MGCKHTTAVQESALQDAQETNTAKESALQDSEQAAGKGISVVHMLDHFARDGSVAAAPRTPPRLLQ